LISKFLAFTPGKKQNLAAMVWPLKLDQKGCSASLCVTLPRAEDLELLQVDGIKKAARRLLHGKSQKRLNTIYHIS
jgi:hypothetical protein